MACPVGREMFEACAQRVFGERFNRSGTKGKRARPMTRLGEGIERRADINKMG